MSAFWGGATRDVRFQCEAARQLQLPARVDAVMQSTSVLLYYVSADKAGSFYKAEVLEEVNSRRVPVFFSRGASWCFVVRSQGSYEQCELVRS